MIKRLLTGLTIAILLPLVHRELVAQEINDRADRKITGQMFKPHTASTYQSNALNHARVLNHYARKYKVVPKETAKEHLAEIERNLAAAKKEVAKLKNEAAIDKSLQQQAAALMKSQQACEEICKQIADEVGKAKPDQSLVCDCCKDLCQKLKSAESENEKIKEKLGVEEIDELTE